MYWPVPYSEIELILDRQDVLYAHQPKCEACKTNQVQLIEHKPPAQWKCRRCKHKFTSEPAEALSVSNGFFAGLTDEQKAAALAYDGPENHGDTSEVSNGTRNTPGEQQ